MKRFDITQLTLEFICDCHTAKTQRIQISVFFVLKIIYCPKSIFKPLSYRHENDSDFKMSHSMLPFMALNMIDPLQAPIGTPCPVAMEILLGNSETLDQLG